MALDYDLAVKAERSGYHLRLDERIAVLVPPTQEPNSRTRPSLGVSSGTWRASSSSNSLYASSVAEIKGFSKNSIVLSIPWLPLDDRP